jgi:DNA polymerase III subunit delta
MLIKQQALTSHLCHRLAALYVLFGQDHFLFNQAAELIKLAWQTATSNEAEETVLHINNPSDWALVDKEVHSYFLFANNLLIDMRYEKKTLDTIGKKFLTDYLQHIDSSRLLLLRAANLPQKQLQWLINHESVAVVQANPLSGLAMQNWIVEQLQKKAMRFSQQIPILIHQYTQGNMLACAQIIEKLELIGGENTELTIEIVKEQLVDQCDYQLFELADACLSYNPDKAIQLLRHAYSSKVEPTLILWLLAQEIRLLVQLIELTKQPRSLSFNTALSQLKIWPQRAKLYQSALKKIELSTLLQLLQFCKTIDERIKSMQNNQIWHALEQIALSLCLAKQVGPFA